MEILIAVLRQSLRLVAVHQVLLARDDQFGNDEYGEVEEFDGFDVDGEVADAEFEDATGLDTDDPFETDMADADDPFETEMMSAEDPFETLDADPGLDGFPVASSAECNEAAAGEPTDAAGCAMFTGVFEGIEFDGDTAILSIDSGFLLQGLATSLNDYPRLVVELQVHTQDYAEPGRAMQLSRERVLAIARFLVSQGVDVQRLKARAFGSEEPRFNDASPESQRLNNRLALRVL